MSEFLDDNFNHIRNLANDIDTRLSGVSTGEQRLRNELAGMFAVTIAATYEGIVKETLISYAAKVHPKYLDYIEKDLKQTNARISVDDLRAYSIRFGLTEWSGLGAKKDSTTFHRVLNERKLTVERRFRADLIVSYTNLFRWRNAYAHQRTTTATIKDVYEAHRIAQYVIRSFVKAFELG